MTLTTTACGCRRLSAVAATARLVLATCDTTEDGPPEDPPADDGDPEAAEDVFHG